jgi:hypothetical protein
MSENQVSAQYSSPIEAALSLKNELEAYDRDKDRRSLLSALKEQFLLNRFLAASQAENNRNLALRILFNRMEQMSDAMLVKTIKELSEIGALDMSVVMGVQVPGNRSSTVSIQQAFGLPGGGSQPSLGDLQFGS